MGPKDWLDVGGTVPSSCGAYTVVSLCVFNYGCSHPQLFLTTYMYTEVPFNRLQHHSEIFIPQDSNFLWLHADPA